MEGETRRQVYPVKHAYVETETKLYVPDLPAVEDRLRQLGAEVTMPRVLEANVRYENSANTLAAEGIGLRLRQDTRARLTYKDSGHVENGIVSRFDAEVEVSDFQTMEIILGKLGYHPHMRYEKYRAAYTLNGADVTLDELPYGHFVEIEGDVTAIERAIEQLHLTQAPRLSSSYTALFERVKRALGLQFNDLTFANFEGIDVPQSAFLPPQA